jgi:hypothetical protein
MANDSELEGLQKELMQRVLHEHENDPHPGMTGARLRVHASLHVVVETQLRIGDPPATRKTLERLLDSGVDRHKAIHAIGSVVVAEMTAVSEGGAPLMGVALRPG